VQSFSVQCFAASDTTTENQNEKITNYGGAFTGPTHCRLQDDYSGTSGPRGQQA